MKGADSKDTDADLSIVVIGGDGSVPAKSMVDKYLVAHAGRLAIPAESPGVFANP